jgi:hypothetical protein
MKRFYVVMAVDVSPLDDNEPFDASSVYTYLTMTLEKRLDENGDRLVDISVYDTDDEETRTIKHFVIR